MIYNDAIPALTDHPDAVRLERKKVSGLMFATTFAMIAAYVAVLGGYGVAVAIFPPLAENELLLLLVNNLYTVVALLLFWLFSLSHKSSPIKYIQPLTFGKFATYILISISLMSVGSLLGQTVNAFIETVFGIRVYNGVEDIVESYSTVEIIISTVIIAPIAEELFFRKLLIDRLNRYGTGFCVIVSGITFGVFHGNFYQLFYGVALGMLLGYIYCTHGKLRYTILLHALINFFGSVVPMQMLEWALSENTILMMLASLYSIAYVLCIPVGMIILVSEYKKSARYAVHGILVNPLKTLRGNKGFIFFMLYGITMFIFSILAS